MSIYFIDANIVMYAVGREHEYKQFCSAILRDIGDEKITAVTDTEVLQEILYRYFMIGKGKDGLETAKDFSVAVSDVLFVTKREVETTFELLKKYPDLPPRDHIHVAVMINNDIREIISTDKHFDQIEEVSRVDPKEFGQWQGWMSGI
ncbi:MAG: type II toxin-antitoxin system VapC family toxin [Actinomycetota bacterium]